MLPSPNQIAMDCRRVLSQLPAAGRPADAATPPERVAVVVPERRWWQLDFRPPVERLELSAAEWLSEQLEAGELEACQARLERQVALLGRGSRVAVAGALAAAIAVPVFGMGALGGVLAGLAATGGLLLLQRRSDARLTQLVVARMRRQSVGAAVPGPARVAVEVPAERDASAVASAVAEQLPGAAWEGESCVRLQCLDRPALNLAVALAGGDSWRFV